MNFDFFGWFATDSGNEKRVTPAQLDLPITRAARPRNVHIEVDAVATTSTYMVPSNSPVVTVSLVAADGDVVAFSKPTLIPHGSKTSINVRAPPSTPYSQYSRAGTLVSIFASQAAAGTTLSFSGFVSMQFSAHSRPSAVKLVQHIENLQAQCSSMTLMD